MPENCASNGIFVEIVDAYREKLRKMEIRFSKKFKEHISEQKKASQIEKPIPAIMLASLDGRKETLVLVFYDEENLPSMDEFCKFHCDGIEFLVPQLQIHDDLNGRILDISDGKIFLAD